MRGLRVLGPLLEKYCRDEEKGRRQAAVAAEAVAAVRRIMGVGPIDERLDGPRSQETQPHSSRSHFTKYTTTIAKHVQESSKVHVFV